MKSLVKFVQINEGSFTGKNTSRKKWENAGKQHFSFFHIVHARFYPNLVRVFEIEAAFRKVIKSIYIV